MNSAKAPRILVIDDEEDIRETMERMLTSFGCEVTCASNGEEAVAAYLAGPFDLVTLDHRMPGLKGMDLHKVLSQEFGAGKRTTGFTPRKLPPVLLITGYADDPEVIRGQWGESIVGVLQKPVSLADLKRVVGDLLADDSSASGEDL